MAEQQITQLMAAAQAGDVEAEAALIALSIEVLAEIASGSDEGL